MILQNASKSRDYIRLSDNPAMRTSAYETLISQLNKTHLNQFIEALFMQKGVGTFRPVYYRLGQCYGQ